MANFQHFVFKSKIQNKYVYKKVKLNFNERLKFIFFTRLNILISHVPSDIVVIQKRITRYMKISLNVYILIFYTQYNFDKNILICFTDNLKFQYFSLFSININ